MDVALLAKIFGRDQRWCGPCTLIMDAEACVSTLGVDAIVGGGAKNYAPRMVSGRVVADAVCLLHDNSALLVVQQTRLRQPTGEEIVKQSLIVADPVHVVAIEFLDTAPLAQLGMNAPNTTITRSGGSHAGTQVRPTTGSQPGTQVKPVV